MQHAWKHVERPGGSHTAWDGKKRPLTVHCSGLGGGLLSPEHDYDIFFQNHAQMKVYGPSCNDG